MKRGKSEEGRECEEGRERRGERVKGREREWKRGKRE